MGSFVIVNDMLTGNEIRKRFIEFFKAREHTAVPSAPLVPENDPTVLFNTAGMQPLTPYLLGQPHPTGSKRIVNSQKCLRTNDIDEVGDNTHLTFFEMLGNWSLGDYFKKEAIQWSFEFLTSKDEGLGLDSRRLYVTVFAGDENAPQDDEAYRVWSDIFTAHGMDPDSRIFFMDAEANWWSPGDNGPCGPDSEMFYDVSGMLRDGLTREEFIAADDRQDVVEIWNDVFMEYEKKDGRVIGKLTSQNVDTGSGLERITATVQGVDNVFATDLFTPIIEKITTLATKTDDRAVRIIADHIRAATFLISDGVVPSNTDQGYILRRLLRRSIRQADALGIPEQSLSAVAQVVIEEYGDAYAGLPEKQTVIVAAIQSEEDQFRKTLADGIKKINSLFANESFLSESTATWFDTEKMYELVFDLYQTYGFPFELTIEAINQKREEQGFPTVNESQTNTIKERFDAQMAEHQAKSRAGASQKFKGGLADNSKEVVQYHTVTHLLLAALREILGDHVHQAGSNITTERLRFDFTHPQKVERQILDEIEQLVNDKLQQGGVVTTETLAKSNAEQDSSIEGSFWDKYPEMVTVYTITSNTGTIFSRELCGGPHVQNLSEIPGTFKIKKEEAVAAGIRRIKAVLQ